MLRIIKGEDPQFLSDFKRRNNPKTWDDYNTGTIKRDLTSHMLQQEQNNYCVYCEKVITGTNHDTHIEHIKPRDTFPKSFQDYDNIVISCSSNRTCGMHKAQKYNELFINPVLDEPDEYFDFNLADGKIIPRVSDENSHEFQRAQYTIDVLNLNDTKLKEARKAVIDYIQHFDEETLQFLLEDHQDFPKLIQYFINNI